MDITKADKRQKFADALKHTRRFRELRGRRDGSLVRRSSRSNIIINNNKENRRHHQEKDNDLFFEDNASPNMSSSSSLNMSSSSSPNCVVTSLDTESQQEQNSLAPPRVSMSESGAEMTLQDDASSSSLSRLSSLRHVSGSTSLLDEAASPPRTALQPVLKEESEKPFLSSPSLVMSRTSSLLTASLQSSSSPRHQTATAAESPNTPMGLFPCGSGLECCTRVVTAGDVEWQISQFLESTEHTDSWCHGWQAWSYIQLRQQQHRKGEEEEQQHEPPQHDPVSHETVQRILRHRVTDLAVRRDRLATLRRDLCPFEDHDGDNNNNSNNNLFARVTSYQPSSSKTMTDLTRRDGTASSMTLSQPWVCGTFDFSTLQDKLPASPRTVEIGYDSDPEDFCHRRSRPSKSTLSKEQQQQEQQLRPLAEILQDEDAVRDGVQKFMNGKMTFILHQHGDEPCSSHAITAWTELGQNLKRQAIGPRFVWKARYPHSSSASTATANTKKKKKNLPCHSIDLLDVHRILPVTSSPQLDRYRFPLAKAKHCLWIKTVHTSLLLEASSIHERDRIAWGLKLTIARLAMKVICSDPTMADEFFLKPTEDYLEPGNEPKWLTN